MLLHKRVHKCKLYVYWARMQQGLGFAAIL